MAFDIDETTFFKDFYKLFKNFFGVRDEFKTLERS